MSKRPELVRCENCCYYLDLGMPEGEGAGCCNRYPPTEPGSTAAEPAVGAAVCEDHWCGEFRAEWPEEDATRLLEKWAENIVRRDA